MKCGVVEKMRFGNLALSAYQDVDFPKWYVSPIISIDYINVTDAAPLSKEKESAMEQIMKYLLKR